MASTVSHLHKHGHGRAHASRVTQDSTWVRWTLTGVALLFLAGFVLLPLGAVFEALRVYMGSAYVNDFNMFGRTFRVTAQANSASRIEPENVSRIRVRNADAQMVPLGSFVTFREIAGPDVAKQTPTLPEALA